MSNYNPYAPPAAGFPPQSAMPPGGAMPGPSDTNAVRQGDLLVIPAKGAMFPDRCIRCNAPAGGYKLKRVFMWHPPAVYFTILAGLLIYAIVAVITRKSATTHVGLCPAHRARRRNGLLLAWLGCIGSFALMIVGARAGGAVILLGLLGMIGCPVAGILMAKVATPSKIDDHWAWLKVGKPFLDSF